MGEMQVVRLAMKLIDRPRDPVRSKIDPEKIRELAESIREIGLNQPVLVRPMDGRYEVVAGDRRYLAHKFLGLEEIEGIVREMSDEDCAVVRGTENLQREDLTPMEEAKVYEDLRKRLGMSMEKIARKMGRAIMTIKKYLDLVELDPEFQEAIDARKLGVEAAYVLCQIDDPEFRNFYLKSAIENGVTRAVAEMWLAEYRKSRQGSYYAGGDGGGASSVSGTPRPIYGTCGGCRGPVEVSVVKYIPMCPECIKEMERR